MTGFQPVSVTRLYRMIADQITEKIHAGEFLPGARLPAERELAKILQVSRPSVREALIALEIEGYVEVRVGTGVFVAPSRDGVQDQGKAKPPRLHAHNDVGPFELLQARLLVEPECAALAAKNASGSQIAAIEVVARTTGQAQSPGQQDRAFHMAIAEGSGNVALVAAQTTLWDLRENSAMFSRLEQHFVTHKVWQVADREHEEVFQAIKNRDSMGARRALRTHLTGIIRRLREDFASDAAI
ncbi:MAG: FadR/GntR family transcriptional regulator [Paralcaligenes sp.]